MTTAQQRLVEIEFDRRWKMTTLPASVKSKPAKQLFTFKYDVGQRVWRVNGNEVSNVIRERAHGDDGVDSYRLNNWGWVSDHEITDDEPPKPVKEWYVFVVWVTSAEKLWGPFTLEQAQREAHALSTKFNTRDVEIVRESDL